MEATRWLARGAATVGFGPAASTGRALLLLATAVIVAVTVLTVVPVAPPPEAGVESERGSAAHPEVGWRNRHLSRSPPRRIHISTLDINAVVIRLPDPIGVRPRLPKQVSRVGWYGSGISPGEPGSAVLVGAADAEGRSVPAVFADLRQLKTGDHVQVVRADGWTVVFRVRTVASAGAQDGSELSDSRPQLRLVAANPGQQGADPVLVVTAVLVGRWIANHTAGGGQTDEAPWHTPQAWQRQAQRPTERNHTRRGDVR
jgi:hypothetical protein